MPEGSLGPAKRILPLPGCGQPFGFARDRLPFTAGGTITVVFHRDDTFMTQSPALPKTNLDFSDVLACSFHDIKNSLELLACTLDQISDKIPDYPEKNEQVSCLQYEVNRISNTLTYMLTVYNFEQDRYVLDTNYHSVSDFIEETMTHYRAFARTKGVQMEIECDNDLFWFFDRGLIALVLDEALNNSLRYTRDRFKVVARTDDDYLHISIEDNGGGYPPQFLDSNRSEEKGVYLQGNRTGLGIYFAHIIAKSHRNKNHTGYLRLSNDSSLGGGRFTIALP
jgi:K+-sensing histidine kinase KdpD